METYSLLGRKKVLLRARPNLQITSRIEGGRKVYIVKDPVGLQYFHFDELQHFILQQLNGRHSLADIQKACEQRFKPQRISLEEVEVFASQLLQGGLAIHEASAAGHLLFRRFQRRQHKTFWAKLLNPFYIKIPLVDPDRFLSRFVIVGRILFHPIFAFGVLLILLAAVGFLITRWDDLFDELPTYRELFNWHNLFYLWLALGLVKILHELGHGLCCKALGGEVHEMGIVFLFFFPTLYCNVGDCWTLPGKYHRIAVSAAGIYVELIIAVVAVFVWWGGAPDTFLHHLCLALFLVCSIHTLVFNANPLMRFDGYFILSDWIEVPNLAQISMQQLKSFAMNWLGMKAPVVYTNRSRAFLALFALASLTYRCMVIGGVLWLFSMFMKEQRLAWLGLWCVLIALAVFIGPLLFRVARTIQRQGRIPEMKRSRVLITLALVAAAAFIVTTVPFPITVRGVALVQVEPEYHHRLTVPKPGGFLDQLFVRDGQHVRRGDVLAVFRNPELEKKLKLNEAEQALRQEQKRMLATRFASAGSNPINQVTTNISAGLESYAEVEHELTALAQQHTRLKAEHDALTLRVPADGVVMGLASWEIKGKWLEEGEELCSVGDDRHLRALVLVESADRHIVELGKTAWFLGHGNSGTIWTGTVSGVAQLDAETIPPQLSSRIGGEVVTEHDPQTAQERPAKQQFLVSIRLEDTDHRLQAGSLGIVRIDAGTGTLWWRLQRWLGSNFGWGL